MALTKKANTPSFESEAETNTQAVATEPTAQVEQVAQAQVAATTAIAKAATTAIAKSVKPTAALQELENVMDVDTVRNLGIGTFPRMLADRAGLMLDKEELGNWAKVELISFNRRWIVTPGVQGDDAKELVRYSYDKETIEGEVVSVQAYLQQLKDDGYDKASVKEYFDAFGFLLATESDGDIAEEAREMVQLQLSPQSVAQFKSFQIQQGFKIARGLAQPSNEVKIGLQKKEFGSNKFAHMTFSAA